MWGDMATVVYLNAGVFALWSVKALCMVEALN